MLNMYGMSVFMLLMTEYIRCNVKRVNIRLHLTVFHYRCII